MKSAKPTVSEKISDNPIYRALVKAVGYGLPKCADVIEAIKDVTEKYGKQSVIEASEDLLDYEHHCDYHGCRIKPALHNACRGLLGPTPEEWPTWWVNADGSERQGKPEIWPPQLPGPPTEKQQASSELRPFAAYTLQDLTAALYERSWRAKKYKKNPAGQEAKEELAKIESEFRGRGQPIPTDDPAVTLTDPQKVLAPLTESELAEWLRVARERYNKFSPNSEEGQGASREIDAICSEYQRRRLTIPVTPTEVPAYIPKKPRRTKKKDAA